MHRRFAFCELLFAKKESSANIYILYLILQVKFVYYAACRLRQTSKHRYTSRFCAEMHMQSGYVDTHTVQFMDCIFKVMIFHAESETTGFIPCGCFSGATHFKVKIDPNSNLKLLIRKFRDIVPYFRYFPKIIEIHNRARKKGIDQAIRCFLRPVKNNLFW